MLGKKIRDGVHDKKGLGTIEQGLIAICGSV